MLRDATGKEFKKIIVVCGTTDMRKGIQGLTTIVQCYYGMPLEPGTLFLFRGKRSDRIKGLLKESDGWLLLYKRLFKGYFRWPRNEQEALEIDPEEFVKLMTGFTIRERSSIEEVNPKWC